MTRPPASRATVVLTVVAVLGAIYVARDLLAPILVALMLFLLLQPVVDRFDRARVPRPLSAFILVVALFILIAGPILAVWQTAMMWIDDAPQYIAQLDQRISEWTHPDATDRPTAPVAAEAVPLTDAATANPSDPSNPEIREAAEDEAAGPVAWAFTQSIGPLLAQTQHSVVAISITLLTTFFLLASGRTFLNRVLQLIPKFSAKRDTVSLILDLQSGVSSYLLTLTSINVAFGLVAGVVFWAAGVPSPAMWGLGAAICNFVPYLGPIVFTLVFIPACLLSFDTAAAALIAPFAFLTLNILEAYIIGPHIYGHRLSLHPLTVFVGLLIFAWLWGVAGALIAVPLVMCVNMTCQRFESLRGVSSLLCGTDHAIPGPPAGTDATTAAS